MKKYQSSSEPGRYLHVFDEMEPDTQGKVPCIVITPSKTQYTSVSPAETGSFPSGWEPVVVEVVEL